MEYEAVARKNADPNFRLKSHSSCSCSCCGKTYWAAGALKMGNVAEHLGSLVTTGKRADEKTWNAKMLTLQHMGIEFSVFFSFHPIFVTENQILTKCEIDVCLLRWKKKKNMKITLSSDTQVKYTQTHRCSSAKPYSHTIRSVYNIFVSVSVDTTNSHNKMDIARRESKIHNDSFSIRWHLCRWKTCKTEIRPFFNTIF